ncbi:MAG: aminoacyl-tRNA hydrolase [Clostridia bacterium]|nr:aminoacyl-tRNA hydrolase [Clostridia bacterium]
MKNIFLVVGLGNPEKKYFNTYHNIGFKAVDLLCEKCSVKFNKTQCLANVCSFIFNDRNIIVSKPKTYMNLSGNSLASFKNKYKLKNNQILVIADDIDIPVGKFKYKNKGSGGTHNGLRSIVSTIGSDFHRIRIGIGKDNLAGQNLADYVLGEINNEANESLNKVIGDVVDFILNKLNENGFGLINKEE